MEVHAHTHTARKKWTHYFWEFLLLFLAVFCGFLAENFREKQVEHHREKQYMESMIEDLASDTTSLTSTIIRTAALEKGFDSLKNYLYDIENIEKNTSIIYRQNATYTRNILLSLNDQTSTQLRNSGGMRLIRNKDVANAIARYWKTSVILENTINNFNAFIAEKTKSEDIIFNRKFYKMLVRVDSSTTLSIYSDNTEARLMTSDKNLLISYANYTDRLQKFIEQYITPQVNRIKSRAAELMDLIKKEYHLK
jgi:hypothetical protein